MPHVLVGISAQVTKRSVAMADQGSLEEIFLSQSAALWIANTSDAAGNIRCYWCRDPEVPLCTNRPHFFYPLCNDCFRRYERFGEPAPPTAWQRTRSKVVFLTPVPAVADIIDLVTDFLNYKWEP